MLDKIFYSRSLGINRKDVYFYTFNNTVFGICLSFEVNIDGFCAEMAGCKLLNIYPDFTIMARAGGYDGILKDGRKVDFKSSIHFPTWLTAKKTKKLGDSDIYIMLTEVKKRAEYRLEIWATEQDLIKEENLKDWGYGAGREMYSLSPDSDKVRSDIEGLL